MEGKGPRKEQLDTIQCPSSEWQKAECHTTIAMFAGFDDWVACHFD